MNARIPIVGFTGSRVGVDPALVGRAARATVRGEKHIATGCAEGVDSYVIRTVLDAGAAQHLDVFSVFGLDKDGRSAGHWFGSAVADVIAANRAKATVHWWAGWKESQRFDWWSDTPNKPISIAARLAMRSTAMTEFVNQGGLGRLYGTTMIGFPAKPCPKILRRPSRAWKSGSGSGTWATLHLAAGLRMQLIVFAPDGDKNNLPRWGGGQWVRLMARHPKSVWFQAFRWRSPEVVNWRN